MFTFLPAEEWFFNSKILKGICIIWDLPFFYK